MVILYNNLNSDASSRGGALGQYFNQIESETPL